MLQGKVLIGPVSGTAGVGQGGEIKHSRKPKAWTNSSVSPGKCVDICVPTTQVYTHSCIYASVPGHRKIHRKMAWWQIQGHACSVDTWPKQVSGYLSVGKGLRAWGFPEIVCQDTAGPEGRAGNWGGNWGFH